MKCNFESRRRTGRLAICIFLVCAAFATRVQAGSINYGDIAAGNVVYKQVIESSTNPGVPLYGAPSPSGNAILFNPPNFSATSNNGGLAFTDGTLNTQIVANPSQVITSLVVNELGDYTLAGVGGPTTYASISAPIYLVIQAVNGVDLATPILYNTSIAFTGGGTYSLPVNAGVGVPFSGSVTINVDAILAANSISGHATKIQYTMDNSLLAVSQAGTLSFIKKKDVGGVSITSNGIPEPSSIVLAGMAGMFAIGVVARRRRESRV